MRKSTFVPVQIPVFFDKFRQISRGSQSMKLKQLLFSSEQMFENHLMAWGTPLNAPNKRNIFEATKKLCKQLEK